MIHLSGNHTIDAPREQVWPRIFDPVSLLGLIPGCEQIVQTAPGEYRGRLRVGVAAIRGTYQSCVKILEQSPPERCVFEGELTGPTGVVQGQASFTLFDLGQASQIHYEGRGMITGALASVNHRLIEGTANSLIRIGLACLNRQLKKQSAAMDK